MSATTSPRDLENAKTLHSRQFVFDAHSDVPLLDIYPRRLRGEKQVMKRIQLPRHHDGGVRGSTFTVQCDCMRWESDYEGVLKHTLEIIDSVYSEEMESNGDFVVVKTGSELEAAAGEGKFAAFLGLEGGKALEGNIPALRCLYRLGVRSMGLTHNVRNQLGDGAGSKQNYGLTDFGRSVVEEVDKLHMILDLVHLSERGFYDAIETTRSTPIISHSACMALNKFDSGKVPWRNVTDKQIQTLAEKGGVIGVAFLKPFVSDATNAKISDVMKHLEHVIDLVGIDHVGIGPDYVDYATPENQILLGEKNPLGSELEVEGLENVTRVPNFTAALVSAGYSEGEISKILGGNFLRVFKKVLG